MRITIGKPTQGDSKHVSSGKQYDVRAFDKHNNLYLVWDNNDKSWWVQAQSVQKDEMPSLESLVPESEPAQDITPHAGLSADDWKHVDKHAKWKKFTRPISSFLRGWEEESKG